MKKPIPILPGAKSPAPPQVPYAAATLLLVDDDEAILHMYRHMVNHLLPEMKVDAADTGRKGIELFAQRHHAGIVLDFHMPGLSGLETFREIERLCRERNWEMPCVVFCSGFCSSLKTHDIASPARHAFLSKPVSCNQFIDALKTLLNIGS